MEEIKKIKFESDGKDLTGSRSRKLVSGDGTIMFLHPNKNVLHNYDGPALVPEGKKTKAEYYINGVKLTEKEWKEVLKEELPWYKKTTKGDARV
jgi:hypothetical protein